MKGFSYVLFDNYNTLTDFNLFIQDIQISEAEMKTETKDIPRSRWSIRFYLFFSRRGKI